MIWTTRHLSDRIRRASYIAVDNRALYLYDEDHKPLAKLNGALYYFDHSRGWIVNYLRRDFRIEGPVMGTFDLRGIAALELV
jgi:hypothetical protein